MSARCEAGFWKWQFESSRRKRLAAVERSKEARRAAKDALALRAEVARLDKLLADAGVASGRYGELSLRREVARLRKAVPGAEVQAVEIRRLHKVLCKERASTRPRCAGCCNACDDVWQSCSFIGVIGRYGHSRSLFPFAISST